MGRKRDRYKTGANAASEGKFITLHHWMLDCPAFRALSGNAVKLLTRLTRRYKGFNNGEISMSVREAMAELSCAKNTAVRCFRELEEMGFIRTTQKGAFSWKQRHATTWRLTWIRTPNPLYVAGEPATKEFMRWTQAEVKKSRSQNA
ncbi:MAG: hypothetical protein AB7Q23_17905 [Hyphomonadaceae bacterium]